MRVFGNNKGVRIKFGVTTDGIDLNKHTVELHGKWYKRVTSGGTHSETQHY